VDKHNVILKYSFVEKDKQKKILYLCLEKYEEEKEEG